MISSFVARVEWSIAAKFRYSGVAIDRMGYPRLAE
jgi:hypothetical protein